MTEKLQDLGNMGGRMEMEPGHFMVDQFCGLQEGHRLAGSDIIKLLSWMETQATW